MARNLTEAEREEFLSETHVAVLSVAATGGRPPASVPIWYSYVPGGNIIINTAAGRRKANLIQRAGAVTLVVHRDAVPYKHVVVEGTVIEALSPVPRDQIEAIAARYLGPAGGRAFVQDYTGADSVLFTIRPERWFTADFAED